MTPALLRRVGAALYGEHWHSELARDLGTVRRRVQRWETGDAPIPPTLRRNLARLDALSKQVDEMVKSLENNVKQASQQIDVLSVRKAYPTLGQPKIVTFE